MTRKLLLILLFLIAGLPAVVAQRWQRDVLGDEFVMRHVEQRNDEIGRARSTIIRLATVADTIHRGVLYVHGFNDYFFQAELAEQFGAHGYAFYAVDLRRYGRSLQPDDRAFDIRSVDDYFPDIDSAVVEMTRAGISEITLMGHSTGGLITACYMSRVAPQAVRNVILNSPFLDWNLGNKEWLVPIVAAWGRWFPNTKISQGESQAYAESLLSRYHGEWNYNTTWKKVQSPPVTAGWIRAINLAQKSLRDGKADIRVPVLVMRSAHSVTGDTWSMEHNRADGVLDVNDIRKYGLELGAHVTLVRVVGGLHDLVLSTPAVRDALYRYMFQWLDRVESPSSSR